MIRSVLAKDADEPICGDCAVAFGLAPLDKIAAASVAACSVCGNERACFAIRDYHPSGRQRPSRADLRGWQRPL